MNDSRCRYEGAVARRAGHRRSRIDRSAPRIQRRLMLRPPSYSKQSKRRGEPLDRLPPNPVLRAQAVDAFVVLLVAGHDARAVGQRNRGNQEIGVGDSPARSLQPRLQTAELQRRREVQADHRQGCEEFGDHCGVAFRVTGFPGPVGELRCRDPGCRDIVVNRSSLVDDPFVASKYLDADVGTENLRSSISRPPDGAA